MLRPERESARMSKITNDGLTRSGTGCFIATHMATVGVKRLKIQLKIGFYISSPAFSVPPPSDFLRCHFPKSHGD